MSERDVIPRLVRRAARAGVTLPAPLAASLAAYLELLAKWNRKINLTAFSLDPPGDAAIDRLIVEPLSAARYVSKTDRLVMDVGTGGGSPGLPLKLAVPALRMILVEVKVRKCAFLREVIRQLGISQIEVENRRLEELFARTDLHEACDLVTVRAVRMDHSLVGGLQAFLRPGGRVFWFGATNDAPASLDPSLALGPLEPLVPALGSQLRVLVKS